MSNENFPFEQGPSMEDVKKVYNEHSSKLKIIVIIAIVAIVGYTAYYKVEPEEVGVLTRFGKFVSINQPGPHFKIPIIDHVKLIKAKRQLKQEFGFRTESAGVKSAFTRNQSSLKESMMLTGDLNVAVVEWIVHYRIMDPYMFVFKVRNVKGTLRALSEATMRAVIGDYSVTEVLTKGREEILEKAKNHLANLCDRYETGISIQRIELKDSAPPDPVKPSFNEVNQAEQERDRLQNEAWARYNKEIPKARGEAKKVIQEAAGYAAERTNNAKGEVQRFLAIAKEYERSPEVTRTRLYLEAMSEILPKAEKKIFIDKDTKGLVPMLFAAGDKAPRALSLMKGGK